MTDKETHEQDKIIQHAPLKEVRAKGVYGRKPNVDGKSTAFTGAIPENILKSINERYGNPSKALRALYALTNNKQEE